MSDGFGISFYGFFVFAALWCVAYFVWAVAANRDDTARQDTARQDAGESHHEDGHPGRQPRSALPPAGDSGGRP